MLGHFCIPWPFEGENCCAATRLGGPIVSHDATWRNVVVVVVWVYLGSGRRMTYWRFLCMQQIYYYHGRNQVYASKTRLIPSKIHFWSQFWDLNSTVTYLSLVFNDFVQPVFRPRAQPAFSLKLKLILAKRTPNLQKFAGIIIFWEEDNKKSRCLAQAIIWRVSFHLISNVLLVVFFKLLS